MKIAYGDVETTKVTDDNGSTETMKVSYIGGGGTLSKVSYAIRKRIKADDYAAINESIYELLSDPHKLDRAIRFETSRSTTGTGLVDIVTCYTLLEKSNLV